MRNRDSLRALDPSWALSRQPFAEPALELEEYSHFGMVARYTAAAANLPFFPLRSQPRVWNVVSRYVAAAEAVVAAGPKNGTDLFGNPLMCRATTRRGTACQREPLAHNGYCPSHQHLADTERIESEQVEQVEQVATSAPSRMAVAA